MEKGKRPVLPSPQKYLSEVLMNVLQEVENNRLGKQNVVRVFQSRLEESLDEVVRMENHYANRIEKIQVELGRTSQRRRKDEMEQKSQQLVDLYQNIELNVDRVGQVASQAGERLLKLDRRRKMAEEAKEILDYFAAFSKTDDNFSGIPAFFTSDKDIAKATAVAQKLRIIGENLLLGGLSSDDLPNRLHRSSSLIGSETTASEIGVIVERIQLYCDNLENRLITNFDRASQQKEIRTMSECATCLSQFQGGGRLISHYLASRPLFLDSNPATLQDEVDSTHVGQTVDLLSRWYKSCLESVKKETAMINEVFPNPSHAVDCLVQRIFEQNVQSYLGIILSSDSEHEECAELQIYLRNVAAAYQKTQELAIGLSMLGCTGIDVAHQADMMFRQHIQFYPDLEFKLLEALHKADMQRRSEDGIDMKKISEWISWTSEAISRCNLILHGYAGVEPITEMFCSSSLDFKSHSSLLDQIYKYLLNHFQVTVDKTISRCSSVSFPTDGNIRYSDKVIQSCLKAILNSIQSITLVISDVQIILRNKILEDMASPMIVEKCATLLQHFVAGIEQLVTESLSVALSSCLSLLEKLMKCRQRKIDYRPHSDDDNMGKPTVACVTVLNCIRDIFVALESKLDKSNMDCFFEEFGRGVFDVVKKHITLYTYSSQGALQLKRDIAEYSAVFKSMRSNSTSNLFEDLSSHINLLIVIPDSVPDLINEDLKISHESALSLLKLREDYKTAKVQGLSFQSLLSKSSIME